MTQIEKAYARISEGQLHLRRLEGPGDALPLVLLHASPSSSASMVSLMRELDGTREVIAFDSPCNGQSCAPSDEDPHIEVFADMIDRACDALGLGEVAVYGTHTGAHIAIAWAKSRPDRVKQLILDGVALLDEELRAEMLERYAHPREPDEFGSQFHWAWQYMRDQMIFFPHYRKDAAHKRAGGKFDARTLHALVLDILNNLDTYHQPYRAVFRHDVRKDVTQLTLPVLLLGDGNGPLDQALNELLTIMPDAAMETGCDTPTDKAEAITRFLP